MNTIIKTALLWGFYVAFVSAQASAETEKNMSLSVDPISLISGAVPITLGIKIANGFSLGLTGYDKFFSLSKTNVQGVGGGFSGKFHLSSPAFTNGWYLKPEFMAGYWTLGEDDNKSKGYSLEPRVVAGYEWIWPAGFVLNLGLGIKYSYFSGSKAQIKDLLGFGFHEFFPNADLGLGWAF